MGVDPEDTLLHMQNQIQFLTFYVTLCFGLFFSAISAAQVLPNHLDPSVREPILDAAAVPTIRFLTTTDFPPFNFRDASGELIGFHVDLAKALCDELDISCTMQSWPWEQITDALTNNQGDALIGGVALDTDAASELDFTTIYLSFPARFVVRRSNEATFDLQSPSAIISVRKGSRHADFARAYFPNVKLLEIESEEEALTALVEGRASAYFGDAMRASFWLNENDDCCRFWKEAYFKPDYFGEGLAIATPAAREGVRAALDAGLARLQRKGKFSEIYLRWFPVSFY